MATQPPTRIRFGVFEIDPAAGEVRKAGLKIRIQDQPFQVLRALLDRPGEVVTRDDLRQKLWPGDTFVDFDHSLNTAINKLREALGDGAETPRFVETVPKRGYRFIAPVERLGQVEPAADGLAAAPSANCPSKALRPIVYFVAGALAAAAAIAGLRGFLRTERPAAEQVVEKFAFAPPGGANSPVISPDGKHIAYVSGAGVQAKLWIQDLDRFEPREVSGSAGVREFPFWSFDSQQIGFAANGRVWRAPTAGGEPAIVCQFRGSYLGGAWKPDGATIVFAVDHQGLYAVPTGGGTPQLILKPDPERWNHFEIPRFLPPPYSSLLLMTAQDRTGRHVAVLHSLSSGRREVEVVSQSAGAGYSPTGHLLYPMNGLLWAKPFSPSGAKRPGEAFPIGQAPIISYTPVSVSLNGALLYEGGQVQWRLRWRDRRGVEVDAVRDPASIVFSLALSPEGGKAAVSVCENNSSRVFVWDFARRTRTLTVGPEEGMHPVWHPSGKLVAFSSTRRGNRDIYLQQTDGGSAATALVAGPLDEIPLDWSPHGKMLVYEVVDPVAGRTEIWYLRQKGGSHDYEARPFLQPESWWVTGAALSPDGRFLAYDSNESGRREVYVQRFPEGGERQQLSEDGGAFSRWSRDGRELFYVAGDTLMAVAVNTVPGFSAAGAKPLFREPNLAQIISGLGDGRRVFEPSPDGQRFLFALPDGPIEPQIRVVRNWFAEFRNQPAGR